VLVWVRDDLSVDDKLDTIIHESVHVFQKLCEYIGEDAPSSEFQAYTIAHISITLIKEHDALHDQREARLQKGSSEVHEQASSSQEEDGAECSPSGNGESREGP
jgi:hypothetical protein